MTRAVVLVALAGAVVVAGCTGGGSSPGPSVMPSPTAVPTPVAAPVSSTEDAAARVIASDKRFAGATQLLPGSIGLTKWWVGRPRTPGGYEISLTLGWGDCPAGCINHHTWVFDVAEDGTVQPVSESGDAVPNT